MDGFVHLWRQSMESRVFKNPELWKVWTWCLMKASHQKRWAEMKSGKNTIEVLIDPGQFIFGRKSAAKELGMPESSVRNRMEKLKNMRNVDIKEDSQYSLISIVNWEAYQKVKKKEDSKEDSQRTARGQPEDTDKKEKKEKKEKNKKNNAPDGADVKKFDAIKFLTTKGISPQVAQDWLATRKEKRLSNTETAFNGVAREIGKIEIGWPAAITMCCERGWGGFKAEWVRNDGNKHQCVSGMKF